MSKTDFNPTKKMITALEKTIQAYDQAILDLETGQEAVEDVADRWGIYPRGSKCRFCNACRTGDGLAECSVCFLGQYPRYCVHQSMHHLKAALVKAKKSTSTCDQSLLLIAFKARRAWILEQVDKLGWEVV